METLNEAYRSGRIMHEHCDRLPRGEAWAYAEHLGVWVALPEKRKVAAVTMHDLLHDPAVDVVKRHRVRDLVERYGDPGADHPHDSPGCACRACAARAAS